VWNIEFHFPKERASSSGNIHNALCLESIVEVVGVAVCFEILVWVDEEDVELDSGFVRRGGLCYRLYELSVHRLVDCLFHIFSSVEKHRTRNAQHREGDIRNGIRDGRHFERFVERLKSLFDTIYLFSFFHSIFFKQLNLCKISKSRKYKL
jgi:hypothetical protein